MVLLTIKNLQHQTFTIEIEMSALVRELKAKIEKEKGQDYPAAGQKLIYTGKILQDDSKLETYIVDTSKFIVIMVSKPKTGEATPPVSASTLGATSSTATETSTQETSSTTTAAASTTTSTTPTTSSTPASAPVTAPNAESMLVMGDEFSAMVQNIMEMGYDRPDVERALRASFNNPYTAVQYLIDGIPESANTEQENPPAGEAAAAEDAPAVPAEAAEVARNDPLAFLQNEPQFRQMTQMMRTNPQLLDAFLQQIRTTNPNLLQAIQENQEEFVRLINQPQGEGTPGGGDAPAAGGRVGGDGAPAEGERGTTIMLTPQDREAIDRLLLLGNFPEELVVQAYFACEKNENQAAEFLFSQTFD